MTENVKNARGLIDRLKLFNAKERYWLVKRALGSFEADRAFIDEMAGAAGRPTMSSSDTSFLAMDYHINWLHAAMSVAGEGSYENSRVELDDEKWYALIENSQQDVDMLLAYPSIEVGTQLLLIEGKGHGSFDTNQMLPKVRRLSRILALARAAGERFDARMVMVSLRKPSAGVMKSLRDACATDFPELLNFEGSTSITPGWADLRSSQKSDDLGPDDLLLVDFWDKQPPSGSDGKKVFWSRWQITRRTAIRKKRKFERH